MVAPLVATVALGGSRVSAVNAFWPTIGQVGLARLMNAEPEMRKRASSKYVELADQGAAIPASEFLQGLEDIWALRDRVGQAFGSIDLIMTPACDGASRPTSPATSRKRWSTGCARTSRSGECR